MRLIGWTVAFCGSLLGCGSPLAPANETESAFGACFNNESNDVPGCCSLKSPIGAQNCCTAPTNGEKVNDNCMCKIPDTLTQKAHVLQVVRIGANAFDCRPEPDNIFAKLPAEQLCPPAGSPLGTSACVIAPAPATMPSNFVCCVQRDKDTICPESSGPFPVVDSNLMCKLLGNAINGNCFDNRDQYHEGLYYLSFVFTQPKCGM
jgi:hypothetical protein